MVRITDLKLTIANVGDVPLPDLWLFVTPTKRRGAQFVPNLTYTLRRLKLF
jgi:hypothetical protein